MIILLFSGVPQSGNGASIIEVNNCGTELLMTSRLVTSLAVLCGALLSLDGKLHLRMTELRLCISATLWDL